MLAIYIMQCKLGQAINLCCYSLAAGVIRIDSIFNVFNTTGLINLCCYNVQLDDYGCAIQLDWSLSICVLSVWLVLYILCTVRLCNFIMPRLWYFICYVFDIQLWLCVLPVAGLGSLTKPHLIPKIRETLSRILVLCMWMCLPYEYVFVCVSLQYTCK